MSDTTVKTDLPIACSLSAHDLTDRMEEIDNQISSGVQATTELADGYEFTFPGSDDWAAKLLVFIKQERQCCRFLTFELAFAPDQGPITLRLRGPEGAKEFITTML
ncbi:MAG: hypothetical protein ABI670_16905 [Chloroflexota bacterium]